MQFGVVAEVHAGLPVQTGRALTYDSARPEVYFLVGAETKKFGTPKEAYSASKR